MEPTAGENQMAKIIHSSAGGNLFAFALTFNRTTTTTTAIMGAVAGGVIASFLPQENEPTLHILLRLLAIIGASGLVYYAYQRSVRLAEQSAEREIDAISSGLAHVVGAMCSPVDNSPSRPMMTHRDGPESPEAINEWALFLKGLGLVALCGSSFILGAVTIDTVRVVEHAEVAAHTDDRVRQERLDKIILDLEEIAGSTKATINENRDDMRALMSGGRKLVEDPRIPKILSNIETVTTGLAVKTPHLIERVERLIERAERLLERVDTAANLVDKDQIRRLISDAVRTMDHLEKASKELVIASNKVVPLVKNLNIVAQRATGLTEVSLRRFLQAQGIRFRLTLDRTAREILKEDEE